MLTLLCYLFLLNDILFTYYLSHRFYLILLLLQLFNTQIFLFN